MALRDFPFLNLFLVYFRFYLTLLTNVFISMLLRWSWCLIAVFLFLGRFADHISDHFHFNFVFQLQFAHFSITAIADYLGYESNWQTANPPSTLAKTCCLNKWRDRRGTGLLAARFIRFAYFIFDLWVR